MSKAVARAIERLLPHNLPPTISKQSGNLYEILARTTSGGVGQEVYQSRWSSKGIPGCYWRVTRANFKLEGTRGKAWGKLYWKGKCVSEKEERIRGALKYTWEEGRSQAPSPSAVEKITQSL